MSNDHYQLEKVVWTADDFEVMGWHDCSIHGVSFLVDQWELAFDIDYLFKWVTQGPTAPFKFWMSPATLVFHEVNGFKGAVEVWTGCPLTPVIFAIERSSERNRELAGSPWKWIIKLEKGELEFHASGFSQFIRSKPTLEEGQNLRLELRGGVSFNRTTIL